MQEMVSQICREIIGGVFTLLAASFGVWLGAKLALSGYFRQKEYELVKERYLEGALDIVASEVEVALGITKHNWARCLNILKAFRDEREIFDLTELSKGFLELDISRLNRIAVHRIEGLVGMHGAQVIWGVYQLALAFAANSNANFTKEIPEVVRIRLNTTKIDAEYETIAKTLMDQLEATEKEEEKFAHLTYALHHLSAILEKEHLTFSQLEKFRDRADVKRIIKRLECDFAEELKPLSSDAISSPN